MADAHHAKETHRYTLHERETVVEMFLSGIDHVSYDVLREAVRLMQQDSQRIDRLERAVRNQNRVQLEVWFSVGRNLRYALDRLK